MSRCAVMVDLQLRVEDPSFIGLPHQLVGYEMRT